MNKEKWIDDILKSGKEIIPVSSDPFLVTRIEGRILQMKNGSFTPKIQMQWVYTSAITMVLLITINLFIWKGGSRKSDSGDIQQLMNEYGWNNQNLNTIQLPK